jgi:hypothetical protein
MPTSTVAMPFRGFHLVVTPENRASGCLPAEQFLPQLMEYLALPYYAGLLSAAGAGRNRRWRLLLNEVIEPDL